MRYRWADTNLGKAGAASGAVVDTTVVAGGVLMRHRQVEGADEVVANARAAAHRLGLSQG